MENVHPKGKVMLWGGTLQTFGNRGCMSNMLWYAQKDTDVNNEVL
jgi:hypothetical protein